MTNFAITNTPRSHSKQGAVAPIAVIPTSVVCLQRWQVEWLVGQPGSPAQLADHIDAAQFNNNAALTHIYLDYTRLCCDAPEIVLALKELSGAATAGCRVNVRHASLLHLLLWTYGLRATGWEALQYVVVEARASDVFAFLTSVSGGVPCLHQQELSFDAGHPFPLRARRPSRSPLRGAEAASLVLV